MCSSGEGALEEGGPKVIDGVADGDGEHAFVLEAARGGEHLQIEGEEHFADGVQAARDVGVFAVEGDGRVEAADGFERLRETDEVATLHHGADAQNVAVDRVSQPGDAIEDADERR